MVVVASEFVVFCKPSDFCLVLGEDFVVTVIQKFCTMPSLSVLTIVQVPVTLALYEFPDFLLWN